MRLMRVTNGIMKAYINYDYIYVPGNVPSAKNSKQKTKFGIISSKASLRYKHDMTPIYNSLRRDFQHLLMSHSAPYNIGFHFIRATKGRFDFNNMTQMVQDMMVASNWIEDDNVRNMIPFPLIVNGRFVSLSKEQAGVIIAVVNTPPELSITINDEGLSDY